MAQTYISPEVQGAVRGAFPAAEVRLDALATLAPNWDTHGAQPIAPRAINAARELLRAVAAHPRTAHAEPYFVAPLPHGGVQLEWRKGGHTVEVEVAPDGSFASLLVDNAGCCRTFAEAEAATTQDLLLRIPV